MRVLHSRDFTSEIRVVADGLIEFGFSSVWLIKGLKDFAAD